MAEIAGLVLGAIPLLISALEHYEDVVEPAVAFWQWKGQLSNITRHLYMGHTAYEQNVRILLSQTVDDEDLNTMINDPGSDLWKTNELTNGLQSRLGSAYRPSLDTVKEIASIMADIAKGLNIEGAEKV